MTAAWREFENEVGRFFERADFRIEINPAAAKPRQTDLIAIDDRSRILIEVKRRSRNIDVGDIASLHDRLARTPPDFIGAIFSTSDISPEAISEIEQRRSRPVLVFLKAEIEGLRSGGKNIRALIEQKLDQLTLDGRVWTSSRSNSTYLAVQLPKTEIEFNVGNRIGAYFESKSDFRATSFSLKIPYTGSVFGEGARLALRLEVSNITDLRDLFGYLHKNFGLSKDGMFFIHQTENCWHGAGASNFLDAVEKWRERYKESSCKNFHHSEEANYFDNFQSGRIEVSIQQRIDFDRKPTSFLHMSELEIHLPGVPVNTSRYVKLCHYVGDEGAHFDSIHDRWTETRRLKKPIRLQIVGKVVEKDRYAKDRIVIGLIAKNPFYGKRDLVEELVERETAPVVQLDGNELLLCDLRDHHPDYKKVDYYELQGIEATVGATGTVIRPFGTWNKMMPLKRGRSS